MDLQYQREDAGKERLRLLEEKDNARQYGYQ